MPEQTKASSDIAISFGPFRLFPTQRLLLKGDKPTRTGSRALEILIHLVQRAGEVVDKDELISRVWSKTFVEDTNLRVHIAALRRALGDRESTARYITTVPGRGYCFVAPVERLDISPPPSDEGDLTHNLAPLNRVVGREETVAMLAEQLPKHRFVTIVGPGGIGKTTVGLAVAHRLVGSYTDGIRFVDLAPLRDDQLVPNVVAFVLGLAVHSEDVLPALTNFLKHKQMLLVLDNCEHVIDAAAILVEQVLKSAPGLQILATSREPLRAEGEHVQHIAPLAVPASSEGLTATEALTFPAIQLFVERAAASLDSYVLTDSDAPAVADICRRLDGIALAIELAAVRADALGVRGIASLLNDRFRLLATGRRTALRRHQTLGAALDWSHELLADTERTLFRRLAVFVGDFAPEAASAVASGAGIAEPEVFDLIVGLVEKSLVIADIGGDIVCYRLLETTRAYALEKLIASGEFETVARRHAEFYRDLFERAGAEIETRPRAEWLANVRAALEWCFGANGNVDIGVGLATAAAPVFLAMSLLTECYRWSERALRALDYDARGGIEEMHLQAAAGLSLMFTPGSIDAALAALRRSFAIAEERGDTVGQLKLLAPLQMLHIRLGEFKTALRYARRSVGVAAMTNEPAALALAHSLLGNSLHFSGDLSGARAALEAALCVPSSPRASTIYLGLDHHNRASYSLARTLWLQGLPAQAVERARQAIADAAGMDHPVTLYLALIWGVPLFLWTGDLKRAEEYTDQFIAHAQTHSLGPYVAVGRGFKGELAIRRGDPKRGVESLVSCLDELHPARYEPLTTTFNIALVQGLAAIDRLGESITLMDETIGLVTANGDLFCMPELLRVKGGLLLSMSQPVVDDVEACFLQSLEWSRRQGARAWELRTAIDLAAFWASRNRREAARALLPPVFEQFVEGLDTADLKAAKRLLATLG
jgi:predicted ATPase